MSPAESLNPVTRLRVLAAALPGSVVAERTLRAPFERVWRVVSDLEEMVPRYESHVEAIEIVERRGERLRLFATLRGGRVEEMSARLTPGWCLMQSEDTVVAFGARPAGETTVIAHLEHRRHSPSAGSRPFDARVSLLRELETIGSLAIGHDRPARHRGEPTDQG